MSPLLPDTIEFLRELELNNNREWFEANRKRYEASVKKPLEAFATQLIDAMQELDDQITMQPKDAIFRINRDTRFSKDKTPYKNHLAVSVSRAGKNDHSYPGIFVHVDPRHLGIGSGAYHLEPPQLLQMRQYIAANLDEFEKLLADPTFKKHFGEIRGEKGKVLPPELKEAAARQPLIFNKQFYYWAEHEAEEALRDDLIPFLMSHFKAAQPLNAFFVRRLS